MNSNATPPPTPGASSLAPSECLTVEEAAAILRVHPKTLYEAIRAKSVPGVLRLGRAIRIGRASLSAWIEGKLADGKSASSGR